MPDIKVARALAIARLSGTTASDVAQAWHPASIDEAYEMQSAVGAPFGEVLGWKVSATSAAQRKQMRVPGPICAPLFARWTVAGGGVLPINQFVAPLIECEYAFEISGDLVARDKPYSREEVEAAIASVRPAFEIVDSRLQAGSSILLQLGDGFNNGGFVVGEGMKNWRDIDFRNNRITLQLQDAAGEEKTAAGTAEAIANGDPVAAVVAMANIRHRHHAGLQAGQIVTTGSCTGALALAGATQARALFPQLGELSVRFNIDVNN